MGLKKHEKLVYDRYPYQLDFRPIVEGLASRCVFLSRTTKAADMLKTAVAIRLISLGDAGFPAWMISGYKAVNAAELLHLYLSHGYVLLAAALAVDYLEAALGNGKEYFGFKNAIHANSTPVWLPFNLLDQVLLALKEHQDEAPLYENHYFKLNQALDNYLNVVKRVSTDMLTVAQLH
jgi:nuclear pore complex protein Nup160